MRRLIVVVLLALSALASSHAGNAADDPIEAVALAAVNPGGAASKKIFFSEGDTFAVTSVETRGGRKYVRLSRKHLGIPVADEVVRLEFTLTGELVYAAPTLLGPIELTQVTPQVSSGDAERFALSKFPYHGGRLIEETKLVIYFSREVKPTLSWLVRIGGRQEDGTPSNYSSFVSAQELKILGWDDFTRTVLPTAGSVSSNTPSSDAAKPKKTARVTRMKRIDPPNYVDDAGLGNTFYSEKQSIHDALNTYDATYTLGDLTRGGHYIVNATSLYIQDEDVWGSTRLRNATTVAADAAYVHQKAWDYFANTFGYKGYDGHELSGAGWVHYLYKGRPYRNAAFAIASPDDSNPLIPNGSPMIEYGDGDADTFPFVALDVATHEFTHGIAHYTARIRLGAGGEPGGVDEGFADIFGAMIKFYSGDPHYTPNYLIGDRVFKHGGAMASLQQPSAYGANDCAFAGDESEDRHVLRGPVGHAYYIFAEGASKTKVCAPTDGPVSTAVSGQPQLVSRDQAQQIFFSALRDKLTAISNFLDARDATLAEAALSWGINSPEYNSLEVAWILAGVYSAPLNKYAIDIQQNFFQPISVQLPAGVSASDAGSDGLTNIFQWPAKDGIKQSFYLRVSADCGGDCLQVSASGCYGQYATLTPVATGVYEGTFIVDSTSLQCGWPDNETLVFVATNYGDGSYSRLHSYALTVEQL